MGSAPRTVLVVGLGADDVNQVHRALLKSGGAVRWLETGAELLDALDRDGHMVVLVDGALEDVLGLCRAVNERHQGVMLIATRSAEASFSVDELAAAGATECIADPLDARELDHALEKAFALAARAAQVPAKRPPESRVFLAQSAAMRGVQELVERAAASRATALIRGETGTGKEVVARAIHSGSGDGPFVKIDCTALPEGLLESELFGHEKGAFTGATGLKRGRVELSAGGTLFLDEIGELPLTLQAKLLRLLQDRTFERLGGTASHRIEARIVAATHQDLEGMVARGAFRQDLFYRLAVLTIWLPPLRARRDDIEPLARHFFERAAVQCGKPDLVLTADGAQRLRRERWEGNVRELENVVERLVVFASSQEITARAVERELLRARPSFATEPVSAPVDATMSRAPADLETELRAAERAAIAQAIERAGGNRALAARLLGVSRSTLYEKLAEHGLH